MRNKRFFLTVFAAILLAACQPETDGIPDLLQQNPVNAEFGVLPEFASDPADNPSSIEKINLGRALFWDPILSGGKDVACVTCHHPSFGYADGRDLSIGAGGVGLGPNRVDASNGAFGQVPRNAPSILNTAFNGINQNGNINPANAPMFWDVRLRSLENQALGPVQSVAEMVGHAYGPDMALDSIERRLRRIPAYRQMFADAFGGQNAVTSLNMARAIAAFERTILANNSPYDRYAIGNETALSPSAVRGMDAFQSAGCDGCHGGPMFSDYAPHVLGVPENRLLDAPDDGVNGTFAFRTPTLRNLNVTGPFFHNGVARDLQEVMNFYFLIQNNNNGGNNNGPGNGGGLAINPNVNQVDPLARNLRLNRGDIDDIIAFMRALEDDDFDRTVPSNVPSGLQPGGTLNPG